MKRCNSPIKIQISNIMHKKINNIMYEKINNFNRVEEVNLINSSCYL